MNLKTTDTGSLRLRRLQINQTLQLLGIVPELRARLRTERDAIESELYARRCTSDDALIRDYVRREILSGNVVDGFEQFSKPIMLGYRKVV